jgi:O-acetylhomoserine/O-acetylserine sulfhydrylase-like pyridoxal-dependent enzyme
MALDFHSNGTTLISPSHPSEISKRNQAPLKTIIGAKMAALEAGVSSMCNASAAK